MLGYFVIVRAKYYSQDVNGMEEAVSLFKVENAADLGKQLQKTFGDDLGDFSVSWIGSEDTCLDINEDIAKELEAL